MSAEHGEATGLDGGVKSGGSASILRPRPDKHPYQLLPPLTGTEYAALRDSIAAEGVRVPIQVDEDGVILDGHHRSQIAAELGIECPRVMVSNLDTTAKRTVALSLNLSRRHLNREQARQVIAASIEADPDLSDREHARRLGVSPTTVGTVRKQLALSKVDSDKQKIAAATVAIEGMKDALVALVVNGQLRDDVQLERTLRQQVPEVDGAAEELAETVSDTADRVRGVVRAHDRESHERALSAALQRYGIDGVANFTTCLPWMTRSEFDGIAESAAARGWILPVVVTRDADGKLILVDGRCRLVASMRDGVPECQIREADLKDPDHYSYEVNVLRYSATPDERAERKARLSKLDTAGGADV